MDYVWIIYRKYLYSKLFAQLAWMILSHISFLYISCVCVYVCVCMYLGKVDNFNSGLRKFNKGKFIFPVQNYKLSLIWNYALYITLLHWLR